MQEPGTIYKDESILVVDKPAGLPVHADGKTDKLTLVDWLLEHFPDIKGVGEEQRLPSGVLLERPGIVHRIDADTSGALVVARTEKAFGSLKKQFKEREVRKVYRSFVYGWLMDERGIIDKPIGSARGGKGPRSARQPHGVMRDAVTMYRTIARNEAEPEGRATYLEVFPKTGRTHQIRVHFAAVQHPIIADPLYAPQRPPLLGFSRLALHALSLTFRHPESGKEVTFEAPLPADFMAAEKELRASL